MNPDSSLKLLEGKLWKKGQYNKSWKERFFILYDTDDLAYYPTEHDLKHKGKFSIYDIYEIKRSKPLNENQNDQEFKEIFELVTESRTYTLKCPNYAERTNWLTCLNDRIFPDTIHSGYLYSKKLSKNKWTKCYAELNVLKQIRFFENKDKKKIIKVVFTANIKYIKLERDNIKEHGKNNVIRLKTNDECVHYIAGETHDIRMMWHRWLEDERQSIKVEHDHFVTKSINQFKNKHKDDPTMEEIKKQNDSNITSYLFRSKSPSPSDTNNIQHTARLPKIKANTILGIEMNPNLFTHVVSDCIEEKSDECKAMQRIAFILCVYQRWIETAKKAKIREFNGICMFIDDVLMREETNLNMAYNHVSLMNDYHHIIEYHDLYENIEYMETVMFRTHRELIVNCDNNGKCIMATCPILQRHYRSRASNAKNKNARTTWLYYGYGLSSKEVNSQQILDEMHCYLLHTNDIKKGKNDLQRINSAFLFSSSESILPNSSNDDIGNDDDDINKKAVDLDKIGLSASKSILKKKQENMKNIMGDIPFKMRCTKFASSIKSGESNDSDKIREKYVKVLSKMEKKNVMYDSDDSDSDNDDDSKKKGSDMSANDGSNKNTELENEEKMRYLNTLEVGQRYYYWAIYAYANKERHVYSKWDSLKQFATHNTICCISKLQWGDVNEKAQILLQCDECRKKISKFGGWVDMSKRRYFIEHYQMKREHITKEHIIAVLLYCNFTYLRFHFSQTINNKAQAKDVERHSEFATLAKLLRECVEIFGREMRCNTNNNKKGEMQSFYHLICNAQLFETSIVNFGGVLSCTTDLDIALVHCDNSELIIDIGKYGDIGMYYFDCQWLSDYTNECECLMIGGCHYVRIQNIIHIQSSENYKYYVNAMSIIQCIVQGQCADNILLYEMAQYRIAIRKLIEQQLAVFYANMQNDDDDDGNTKTVVKTRHRTFSDIKKQCNRVPEFVMKTFANQCAHITKIVIDANTICTFDDGIEFLFISEDYSWPKIDLFVKLFGNLFEIVIECKMKIIFNLESIKILISTLDELSENGCLQTIRFNNPNKESVKIKDAIKLLNQAKNVKKMWKINEVTDIGFYSIVLDKIDNNKNDKNGGGDDDDGCCVM